MSERLVAVSYPADDETEARSRKIIGDRAHVVFIGKMNEEERRGALSVAEVLMSWQFSRELSADDLARAKRLGFVQLLNAGVDASDLAAVPQNVAVASNVGAYSEPMAEHVMAMTLALAKRLPERHAQMARGDWDQRHFSLSLDGALCAIVGYGGIGKATARLMRCFGARIWALNKTGRTQDDVEFTGTLADLDHVLREADVVVLSIPLTTSTRALIGARELEQMKPKAILINVARGAIVDERALYDHLRSHPEFRAGIDTWWHEPLRQGEFRTDFPFFELPNLIGSPHNSAIVSGINDRGTRQAMENVMRFLRDETIIGVVRREDYI